jgi:Cu+-exporting ATPase
MGGYSNPLGMWLIATLVCGLAVKRWYIAWCYTRQDVHYLVAMDIPFMLGVAGLYGYSVLVTLNMFSNKVGISSPELYFAHVVWLITFRFFFDYVYAYLCIYSLRPLCALMKLKMPAATLWVDNEWRQVPIEKIKVGDRIRVLAGDTIPVDGVIITGASSMNERQVTGMVTMVFKEPGDKVIAGTINLSGSCEIRAEKIGDQRLLAKIIALVRYAYMSKTSAFTTLVRHLDIFVMVIACLALTAFLIWVTVNSGHQWVNAVLAALSVVCIASMYMPLCALSIAYISGVGRALQEGIVVKHVKNFDLIRRVDLVVFDKTGTLTYGKYKIQKFEIVPQIEELFVRLHWTIPPHVSAQSYVKAIIRMIESKSDHAVASAVVEYLAEYILLPQSTIHEQDIEQFVALPGLGVRCLLHGHTIIIGSQKYMEQEGIALAVALDGGAALWAEVGKTVSFVAFDNQLIAYFSVSDTIRDGVSDTIALLKKNNIKTVLITGDAYTTGLAIAQLVGIDSVLAPIAPEDKALHIRRLRQQPHQVVAMVGDGIQDASALAGADVGIIFRNGIDTVLDFASIVFLREDMVLVARIITLAQLVMRTVYRILMISLTYNGIAISMAMGLWYVLTGNIVPPLYAAIIMITLSLFLMIYALRVQRAQLT